MIDTANTLEQSQIEKLSFASEKGDEIARGQIFNLICQVCILYTILILGIKKEPATNALQVPGPKLSEGHGSESGWGTVNSLFLSLSLLTILL